MTTKTANPEAGEPPMPLPNQTTIDSQPLPPACKSADFDKANVVRRRFIKQLKDVTPSLQAWIVESLRAELAQ